MTVDTLTGCTGEVEGELGGQLGIGAPTHTIGSEETLRVSCHEECPARHQRAGSRLPLGELRRPASLAEAVLLAFDSAVVATEHAFLLERRPKLDVDLDQRTGDTESQRIALTGRAAVSFFRVFLNSDVYR